MTDFKDLRWICISKTVFFKEEYLLSHYLSLLKWSIKSWLVQKYIPVPSWHQQYSSLPSPLPSLGWLGWEVSRPESSGTEPGARAARPGAGGGGGAGGGASNITPTHWLTLLHCSGSGSGSGSGSDLAGTLDQVIVICWWRDRGDGGDAGFQSQSISH